MANFPSITGAFEQRVYEGRVLRFTKLRCKVRTFSMIMLFWLGLPLICSAQVVEVKLFEINSIDTVLISPSEGQLYLISEDDTLMKLSSNEVVRLTLGKDQLKVKSLLSGLDSSINTLSLEGEQPKIRIKRNSRRPENFDGTIRVSANKKGVFQLINRVEIDSYVSRVLIEEVGYNVPTEYLKIQAIISRTYAVRNLGRHGDDGFDLCNSVHCQVYDGKKEVPSNIHEATAATSGTVITDHNGQPILAAFHANCGGKTANSEHVWNSPLPYLTSTVDTFCLSQRSATWSKSIDLSQLKKYVRNQTGKDVESLDWAGLTLDANRTGKTIQIFDETFSLPMMRRDLQLKSTVFTMRIEDGKAHFEGKGFGHGVGLCQQGAINMARQKYDHRQILGHYFKGTRLEPISDSMLTK